MVGPSGTDGREREEYISGLIIRIRLFVFAQAAAQANQLANPLSDKMMRFRLELRFLLDRTS